MAWIPHSFTPRLLLFAVVAVLSIRPADASPVTVREEGSRVALDNGLVRLAYDRATGTWSAGKAGVPADVIRSAVVQVGPYRSDATGTTSVVRTEPLDDSLGLGRALLVTADVPHGPRLLLRLGLYGDSAALVLTVGVENTTLSALQIREMSPMLDAVAFAGADTMTGYHTLDGFGGGQKTFVSEDPKPRRSLNNLLATFGGTKTKQSVVIGGLSYAEFEKEAAVERAADGSLHLELTARDPVGKRVDPGARYLVDRDRFYVDFVTTNPFVALETYAERVRLAQDIVLPVCRFPIVDTWFAQVPHFGGGEDHAGYRARNDSVGAVEEMECVARSGFLKYAPVAVLLEPDLYETLTNKNTQQGWWDDAHWQRGPDNRVRGVGSWVSSNGQFVQPYETAKKWAGAVRALGGIPMIYVQTGFRSLDYAEAHPDHMLFNEPNRPFLTASGEQAYRDAEKKYPRKLGYDYTDPGFIAHVREVWSNLRLAGIQGVKFDYPDYPFTGWPTTGGMEDAYATTAMHYRNVFRLAHDGLGPESFVHERTLARGSDVTLGLVTSQRTEGDTDKIDPAMVSRAGLRWYKNRVVVDYDLDGKNPFHAVPANRDGERAMLTMTYVVAGTLMIVPSFGRMSPDQIHDLSRLYPFHARRQSARPVDAFERAQPEIYDFRVDDDWHQLTFYNTDPQASKTIAVDLAGDTAFGALGLDPTREYYAYDFWNDRFLGRFSGRGSLSQTPRAGEARMMSIRAVADHPQLLATDRHLMQGLEDVLGCEWDETKHVLRGVSAVVGGEPYRLILATNGHPYRGAVAVDNTIEQSVRTSRVGAVTSTVDATVQPVPGTEGLVEVTLRRSENGPVVWSLAFD